MSALTKKILESGLVDEATARMMEKWGVLPEGSSDLVQQQTLKDATRSQLMKFAEDIGDEVEKHHRLKETMLDLKTIRWPATVSVWAETHRVSGEHPIHAVIDYMGRYYFRPGDVDLSWFVPGRRIVRGPGIGTHETIMEVTELFVGDDVAAIQVTARKE